MKHLALIIQTLLILALIFAWAMRLEVSIAKIQTDLVWIKAGIERCQPSLEKGSH